MQEIETTTPAAARGQSAQMVWDAIIELHNAEKRINRQSIAALTGLRPTIVDDHVERLRDAGKLARAGKGDLELLDTFPPPRPISKTELSNGLVKIEIGDTCLDLSPKEMRMLYRACAGHARDMHEIDEANKAVILCHELARENAEMRKELRAIRFKVESPELQLALNWSPPPIRFDTQPSARNTPGPWHLNPRPRRRPP